LYVKQGINTRFVICDAGVTELIRPTLYEAFDKIENLSLAEGSHVSCDVVGPIYGSSNCFGKALIVPSPEQGHLIGIPSAGPNGEVMSTHYNLRG
jgi:diaminopimelate decarboxylase